MYKLTNRLKKEVATFAKGSIYRLNEKTALI